MAIEDVKLTVTASAKIEKYDIGHDPEIDTPFEVVESVDTLVGDAAVELLKQLGVIDSNGGATNGSN